MNEIKNSMSKYVIFHVHCVGTKTVYDNYGVCEIPQTLFQVCVKLTPCIFFEWVKVSNGGRTRVCENKNQALDFIKLIPIPKSCKQKLKRANQIVIHSDAFDDMLMDKDE